MRDVEVLLQQSVKHLGLVGDVVNVKPGFARNFLFPHKLGVPATEDAKRQIARRAAKVRVAEDVRLKELTALIEQLESLELNVIMKADPNGNLYGSVHADKIVEMAAEQGATFTEKDVRLEGHIKTVGEHHIKVHIRDDDYGMIVLHVEAEAKSMAALAAEAAAEAAIEAESEGEHGDSRQDGDEGGSEG
jgi:large subunit ribosomal protein L9